jgi:hypothetical protein
MGIFDDAIRQHLDLKRRQGADESELKQLEDEAFGLPARPGDPDFPETGESAAAEHDGEAGVAAAPQTGPAEPLATVKPDQPPEPEPEPEAEAPKAEVAPTPDAGGEPAAEPAGGGETPPHGDALLADPEASPEPPPAEDRPVEDEGAPSFSTSERQAIADQPTEFFDQAPAELELGELDLDLEDEIDEVGSLEDQPLTDEQLVEEAAPAEEPPAEEPQPEPEPPADEPAPPPAEPPEPSEASAEDAPAEAEPAEGEEEDVLEETPEFLRDNPDDDELWFEQGQPKDFDF